MTIPFDTSPPPPTRPVPVTFNTDGPNADWLKEMMDATGLDRSLIVHRIVEKARESASLSEGERRAGERRSA